MKLDKNGNIILTPNSLEMLKFAGINIKEIPYSVTAGEAQQEVTSIKKLEEKIQTLEDWKKGKILKPDGSQYTEGEILNRLNIRSSAGDTADAVLANLREEHSRRSSSLKKAIAGLEQQGYKILTRPEEFEVEKQLSKKAKTVFDAILNKKAAAQTKYQNEFKAKFGGEPARLPPPPPLRPKKKTVRDAFFNKLLKK